ncbi:gamma-glutamyltransferase family protein [Winogradskya humida]|uniref:Gamma-glutamyltranspeptidase n=1 Tax=Winogradskya humida TaxID=113566 RepID=A0ABQ3ZYW7_9ACTN|nr:gamma-glutamyltransferase [Actinoplanes humidus]GIE23773.1 gamma-glutamyltranspeptidase [Actinoplanes humidus]
MTEPGTSAGDVAAPAGAPGTPAVAPPGGGGRVALAAPHPAAVEAGRTAVAAGGNAFDAALAAAAALTVVYPHQCSIGGDLIAIVRPAGGAPKAVLSIGAAAQAVDVDALRAAGPRIPMTGPLSVTVPGVVAGWAAVFAQGARLPWAAFLEPAITLAAGGAPVSPGLARAIRDRAEIIAADPGLSAVVGGLAEGDPLVQPALAESLTAIAANWRTFYKGHLGHRLAAGLERLGSPLTAADFAAHEAEVTEPMTTEAYGATWAAAPPPSQGATFLAILGAEDLLPVTRRAQLARDALLGDPRTGPVDVDGLLLRTAREHAPVTAGPRPTGDTVAVTAVDEDGNAVTLIQSVFQSFGSGLLDPDTGIVLHNRGSMFSLDPEHPGRIAPGARPPHTLCPSIAISGDTVLALGCQGGRSQPWILAQVAGDALNAADPAAVVGRPRWVIGSRDVGYEAMTLLLEPGLPDTLAAAARGLGLDVATTAGPHDDAGHVQVARLSGGTLACASDPRADGIAAVL